jgi:hypothetical protein
MKELILLPKQEQVLASRSKNLLLSGAFRSSKTIAALLKIVCQHLTVPNNRGLIGRLTYPELRDTVQKDFFNLMPEEWIAKWDESKGELRLKNGTEVLFRHLDTVSKFEMRGMELGFALIDQVEEISEDVYDTLSTRLNYNVPGNFRQIIMTCNPALFWAYKKFKQNKDPDCELIEFSMLDNKDNLPEDYLADMLKRPESWKRQYVYGVWDESLLSDSSVIPVEYIQQQKKFIKEPLRLFDDIKIYENVEDNHTYQFGFDLSEGVGLDYSTISGWDCGTGNQVAFWRGQIPPDLLAGKAVPILKYFNNALAIPEINGMGLAFLTRLKDKYENIYHRTDFDKETDTEKEMLGWKTTFSTKPLLVDNFLKLLREGIIKIRAQEIINEMSTFVYSDDTKRKGMGAQTGFHDDSIISCMLAVWRLIQVKLEAGQTFESLLPQKKKIFSGAAGY